MLVEMILRRGLLALGLVFVWVWGRVGAAAAGWGAAGTLCADDYAGSGEGAVCGDGDD